MRLAAYGLAAQLPQGWEAGIVARDFDMHARSAAAGERAAALPVAHFATFGLPADRGDFGSDVVERMVGSDAFVSLVEYGAQEVGSALFAQEGLPRRLDPRQFSPKQLQRTLKGQSGIQIFFHEAGRAFCLYVVLGDSGDAHRLVRRVEQLLATIEIGPTR